MAERATSERLLISQAEAACQLGISPRTLVAEIDRGRLHYVLVSRRRKFTPDEISYYAERRRRRAEGIAGVTYPEPFGPPAPVPVAPYVIAVGALLSRVRTGARQRGKQFGLTVDDLQAIVDRASGKCEVSGIAFSHMQLGKTTPFAASVDRINSGKGYTAENCRLVCYAVNVALHEWGDAVLRRIAQGIVDKGLG